MIIVISIQDVSKVFKDSSQRVITAVDRASLEVSEGEIFGVIGYSGAGKSTLIRMLNGLEQPTTGIVEVAGHNLSKLKGNGLRKVRQEIGMIFQHFNILWSRTVRENIAFPLEIAGVRASERNKRVNELIQLVGLEGKGDVYPSELSGGQKQRVGIARSLANNPKVLLCDEATSALDPETTDAILDLLVEINQKLKLTIVLITHEMHVIRKICHRVAVMEQGRVVEVGDVLDIFKNPQQDVTRRFVQQVESQDDTRETLKHLLKKHPTGKVIRLTFIGESAESPILSQLIRDFQMDVNILQGKISQTQKGSVGSLFIHLNGDEKEIERGLVFLHENEVGTEVVT